MALRDKIAPCILIIRFKKSALDPFLRKPVLISLAKVFLVLLSLTLWAICNSVIRMCASAPKQARRENFYAGR